MTRNSYNINQNLVKCSQKKSNRNQLDFLSPTLTEQLNSRQELYLLSHQIEWSYFEEAFGSLYSTVGRPAHSIRLMVSLLILKSIEVGI